MYIHCIAERIESQYYHTEESVFQDINHMVLNCFLYNEPESTFCNDVLKVQSKLTEIVTDTLNIIKLGANEAKRVKQNRQQ